MHPVSRRHPARRLHAAPDPPGSRAACAAARRTGSTSRAAADRTPASTPRCASRPSSTSPSAASCPRPERVPFSAIAAVPDEISPGCPTHMDRLCATDSLPSDRSEGWGHRRRTLRSSLAPSPESPLTPELLRNLESQGVRRNQDRPQRNGNGACSHAAHDFVRTRIRILSARGRVRSRQIDFVPRRRERTRYRRVRSLAHKTHSPRNRPGQFSAGAAGPPGLTAPCGRAAVWRAMPRTCPETRIPFRQALSRQVIEGLGIGLEQRHVDSSGCTDRIDRDVIQPQFRSGAGVAGDVMVSP